MLLAKFVVKTRASEPFNMKDRIENSLECGDLRPKSCKGVTGSPLLALLPLKHPALDFLLGFKRREVSQAQKVFAFEVHALGHELLTAFVVDNPRSDIREGSLFRVFRSSGPNCVELKHPTTAESENVIEAGAES